MSSRHWSTPTCSRVVPEGNKVIPRALIILDFYTSPSHSDSSCSITQFTGLGSSKSAFEIIVNMDTSPSNSFTSPLIHLLFLRQTTVLASVASITNKQTEPIILLMAAIACISISFRSSMVRPKTEVCRPFGMECIRVNC